MPWSEVIEATQLPEAVQRGAVSIITDPIELITGSSGLETRNQLSVTRRARRWQVGYGIKDSDNADRQALIKMAMACGQTIGFLFKDWSDYQVTDHAIADPTDSSAVVGNGVKLGPYYLTRTYTFGSRKFTRRITRPVAAGLVIKVNDVASAFVTLGSLGEFNFTAGHAPGNGHSIKWTGQYLYAVRINGEFQLRIDTATKLAVPTLELKELFEV